jgi:hypothetical protein
MDTAQATFRATSPRESDIEDEKLHCRFSPMLSVFMPLTWDRRGFLTGLSAGFVNGLSFLRGVVRLRPSRVASSEEVAVDAVGRGVGVLPRSADDYRDADVFGEPHLGVQCVADLLGERRSLVRLGQLVEGER